MFLSTVAIAAAVTTFDTGFYHSRHVIYLDAAEEVVYMRLCDEGQLFPLDRTCQGHEAGAVSLTDFRRHFGMDTGDFSPDESGLQAARQAYATSTGARREELAAIIAQIEHFLDTSEADRAALATLMSSWNEGDSFTFGSEEIFAFFAAAFDLDPCGREYAGFFADDSYIQCVVAHAAALDQRDPVAAVRYAGSHAINEAMYIYATSGLINLNELPTNQQILDGVVSYHDEMSALQPLWDAYHHLQAGEEPDAWESQRAMSAVRTWLPRLYRVEGWRNVIAAADMPLFHDAGLTRERADARGLSIIGHSQTGEVYDFGYFPTTNAEVRVGQIVGWDWNMTGPTIDATWLRHPVTGASTQGWGGSHLFRARELRSWLRE
jgi:hypothetical protein